MESSRAASHGSQGPFLHILDSDSEARARIRALLAPLDLQVEEFSSAEEFLDFLAMSEAEEAGRQRCVLTDMHLPGMDALELQARLARIAPATPVVILADHADIDLAVRALRAGVVDFVEKPFVDRHFIQRVRRVLNEFCWPSIVSG